ncbi:MAG: YgiT-type zinc finger protein [Candidatus Tectomicrobia bacterium]|uniref:YgiT-type zinc finger protein n=1 Tax=Tectimicrobiota bacterium TaxID=2528274 RepID=A0A932GQD1_UNCTE|nr:YgiT-type zinc finger protein [Candidatus Tectomicrobia bacterium]
MHDYGECHTCGEWMKERRIKQDFWIKGKLIVIEGSKCGEESWSLSDRWFSGTI